MRLPLRKIAFQPPSDMGTTSPGGGGKVWKILGIGCGILVLICGIALAVGGYKVVSFCGGGIDVVRTAIDAQKFASQFAMDLAKPDFEKAYAKMTPRYQQEVSKLQFVAKFSKYRNIAGVTPVARGFNANQSNDIAEYKSSYFFPIPNTNEMPTIDFTVLESAGEGKKTFLVDKFDIFLAERKVAQELPAQMVMQFHQQISRGQDSMAYMTMGESFRQKSNQDAFKQFLKDAGPGFSSGRWEVQNIKYHTAESATVMVISRRSDTSMLIQFEMAKVEKMGFPLWQIEAIAPLVAGEAPSDAKVEEPAKEKAVDTVDAPTLEKTPEKPVEKPTKK